MVQQTHPTEPVVTRGDHEPLQEQDPLFRRDTGISAGHVTVFAVFLAGVLAVGAVAFLLAGF